MSKYAGQCAAVAPGMFIHERIVRRALGWAAGRARRSTCVASVALSARRGTESTGAAEQKALSVLDSELT
jgi:hypothetical protein